MKSIDFSQFYRLGDPFSRRALRLEPQGDFPGLPGRDDFRIYTGEQQPREPIILKGYMGGTVHDVLRSGMVCIFCVSRRVVDLLAENRFTGWSTYPVKVYNRNGQPLNDYFGLSVTSWVGRIDFSRSQVVTKARVSGGPPIQFHVGLYFDEGNWDGSDIFRINGSTTIMTRAVRDAFVRAKIGNIEFESLVEVERPVDWAKDLPSALNPDGSYKYAPLRNSQRLSDS